MLLNHLHDIKKFPLCVEDLMSKNINVANKDQQYIDTETFKAFKTTRICEYHDEGRNILIFSLNFFYDFKSFYHKWHQIKRHCPVCYARKTLSQLIFKFYSTSLRLNYIIDVWQGSEYI